MQKVDLFWIGAVLVSTLISHWVRAVRWVVMLQPLSQKKISTWNSLCAVMFGYAVNILIPRGGEVVRVIAISKSEDIPWVGVVPTMLIDRLLDLALLVCFVGLTLTMLPPDMRANVEFLVPAGVFMCVATVVGLALLPKGAQIIRGLLTWPSLKDKVPAKLQAAGLRFADQFELGTVCLTNKMNVPIIGALSFGIWLCYFLNFYFCLLAFNLQTKLDLARSLITWTISSVSVIAPTPGCVGGVDPTTALAFATLCHAISFVVVPVAAAAVCFVAQELTNAKRKRHG
jgi:uncharacterized protein (TIRG00374 family)